MGEVDGSLTVCLSLTCMLQPAAAAAGGEDVESGEGCWVLGRRIHISLFGV
jgi:hypothetical protein